MVKFHDTELSNGAQIYYSNGPETHPDIIQDMAALGYKVAPKPRTPLMALKQALYEKFTENMVRPLKNKDKNGYTIVAEIKGEEKNNYPQRCNVTIDEHRNVIVTHVADDSGIDPPQLAAEIKPRLEHFLDHLPGASVSSMMVELVTKELDGVTLRDVGGIYFVPQDNVDQLVEVATLVEKHGRGRNRVTINNFSITAATLRDIQHGIVSEVELETSKLLDELATADLGEKALDNRADRVGTMLERVERYEGLLNTTLESCRSSINDLIDVLSANTAVDEADEVFDDLYEDVA